MWCFSSRCGCSYIGYLSQQRHLRLLALTCIRPVAAALQLYIIHLHSKNFFAYIYRALHQNLKATLAVVRGCTALFLWVPIRGVRRVDWRRALSARTRNWERHRVTLIDMVWLNVATTSSMLDVIICGFNQPFPALKSSISNGCQLLERAPWASAGQKGCCGATGKAERTVQQGCNRTKRLEGACERCHRGGLVRFGSSKDGLRGA